MRPPLPHVQTRVLADPSWWHWALTAPLLAAHVLGRTPGAIQAALALCAAMAAYYLAILRACRPFPVQVRLAFLAWLLVGLLPAMHWMHLVALAGTTAKVTVGYCLLARLLSLLPFNRAGPLTFPLVRRTLLAPPDGGLLYPGPAPDDVAGETPPTCSCSPAAGPPVPDCGGSDVERQRTRKRTAAGASPGDVAVNSTSAG